MSRASRRTRAPRLEVVHDLLDHVEVAPRGEGATDAGQDDGPRLIVTVRVQPDFGELGVHRRIGGVQPLGVVHRDA